LINAGFTDINIAVVRLEKQIPDAARFARGLVHGLCGPCYGLTQLQQGVPYCCKANGLVCPAGVKALFVRK
jgi:hypothetical protein